MKRPGRVRGAKGEFASRTSSGKTWPIVVISCALVGGVILGLHYKSQSEQKRPSPAADSDHLEAPVVKGEDEQVNKDEPTVIKDKEVVEKPKEVVPVIEAKSEVDLLLEEKFPFPRFKSLEEVVKNWEEVPSRAMPERVLVKKKVIYSGAQGVKDLQEGGEHYARPIQVVGGILTLAHPVQDWLRARVQVDDTNLKELVGLKYEQKVQAAREEARVRVLAEREANRAKAVEYLAKRKEMQEEEKTQGEDEEKSTWNIAKRKSDDRGFSMRQYGSRYRKDYWQAPKNGKNSKEDHEIPMGPLCGTASVLYNEKKAVIIDVWDKGPAGQAGLYRGDELVAVDGKRFKEYGKSSTAGAEGVPEQLGMAIIEAQQEARPLELTVKRGSEQIKMLVELPPLPPFGDDFPNDCVRSQALSKAAAEYLVDQQNDDSGLWPANEYTSAWCGLALLSTGEKTYASEIKKLARTFAKKYDLGSNPKGIDLIEGVDEHGSPKNWFVCMVGIFLAEYYLATGDKMVLDAIRHCGLSMDARIHPKNGRFGHSKDMHALPYGGKGLVIINVQAHILWALEAIIDDPENYDWSTWNLSYKEAVKPAFGGGGEVGYNFSARGGSQSSPRTGAMLTALAVAGKSKSDARKMGRWLSENHQNFPNVHAMTFIGPIYGFMGLKNSSMSKYRKAMDNYRWMFSLTQPVNYSHGAYYYSDRGNSGGDEYCKKRLVGNVMAIMLMNSHRDDTLWINGNRKRDWAKNN